jgi:SIR2-like domain
VRATVIDALAEGIRGGPQPVAVLAGAGVSQTAGVSTGQDLLRKAAAERGEDPGADPVAWFIDAFGHFPNYFAIVQGGPGDQMTLPRHVFEGTAPTPAHRALADMAAHGLLGPFLTTNFDRLLERALTEFGLTPRIARDLADMAAEPKPGGPLVVKLHGDYLDLRIRHTPSRLHSYHPVVDALLDRVLGGHDLLVCGWSASWDLPLGAALIRTAGQRRTYWLQCGEPTRRAREIMATRDPLVAYVSGSDAGLHALATAALT